MLPTLLPTRNLVTHTTRYILYVEDRSASSYEVNVESDALWFSRVRTYDTTAPIADDSTWKAEALVDRAGAVVSDSRSFSAKPPRGTGMVERDSASMELVRRENIAFVSHRWANPIVPTAKVSTGHALNHHPDNKAADKVRCVIQSHNTANSVVVLNGAREIFFLISQPCYNNSLPPSLSPYLSS